MAQGGKERLVTPVEHLPPAPGSSVSPLLWEGRVSLPGIYSQTQLGRGREGRQPPQCQSIAQVLGEEWLQCPAVPAQPSWGSLQGWQGVGRSSCAPGAPMGEGAAPAGGCLHLPDVFICQMFSFAKKGLKVQTNSRGWSGLCSQGTSEDRAGLVSLLMGHRGHTNGAGGCPCHLRGQGMATKAVCQGARHAGRAETSVQDIETIQVSPRRK